MTEGWEEVFIRAKTRLGRAALVPELRLWLADEVTPLWQATEELFDQTGMPPPFWAFAWPGGQVLARLLLDRPELVSGKRVLDFAAGCGIAGLAAARAGAALVEASEIDPMAIAAMALNASANELLLHGRLGDLTVGPADAWDVILAGDVCYEKPMAERVFAWLCQAAAAGRLVLLADPGRAYLPKQGLEPLLTADVPTSMDLEDMTVRRTTIYRLADPAIARRSEETG